MSLLVVPLAL
ncbi:MAG: hypothetical protein K0S88_4216, partial [Actinomycetia bacterium]|nr:hypothetical protein [Actinomycetes bacterium]